jgi:hypothetical protein
MLFETETWQRERMIRVNLEQYAVRRFDEASELLPRRLRTYTAGLSREEKTNAENSACARDGICPYYSETENGRRTAGKRA